MHCDIIELLSENADRQRGDRLRERFIEEEKATHTHTRWEGHSGTKDLMELRAPFGQETGGQLVGCEVEPGGKCSTRWELHTAI